MARIKAAQAYEHVSQPPPSYEDIDRARSEYEAGQPTQAFSEVAGEEPSFEDASWSDPAGQDPGAPPPAAR